MPAPPSYGARPRRAFGLAVLAVVVAVGARAQAKPPTGMHGAPIAAPIGASSGPSSVTASATRKPPPATGTTKATPSRPTLVTDARAQKSIAGGPGATDESPELKAIREAELDMFAGAAPSPGKVWPSDLPAGPKGPLSLGGLPPPPAEPPASTASVGGRSLAWLSALKMPDLPVRWDARVIKYLEFFKDDPRGRRVFTVLYRRSGRYRELVQEQLRARGMPEDLAWVALVESGFDPVIRSPAGAAGLWQFMPESARAYGLSVDRWADLRHSPLRSTEAAATFLGDLKKRFGTWELALAAYNMGYGGALAVVKRFNSNDYWELSKFENALPWETTLYVPKIIAIAIVAHNAQTFGYDGVVQEGSLKGDAVEVPAGTELRAIAGAAGCAAKEIESLNPELRAGRTPPSLPLGDRHFGDRDEATYTVLVPSGRGAAVASASAKLAPKGGSLEKYVVRFGETLEQIAAARKTSKAKLVELNGIGRDEGVRGGTTLIVPTLPGGAISPASPYALGAPAGPAAPGVTEAKPIVLVHGPAIAYPDRKRVFYRVLVGDTPRQIAEAFEVSVDELKSWNAIEPSARLQEGMTLQVFVPKGADLARVVAHNEGDVKVLTVGSDEFYALEEAAKGRERATVYAVGGETLESIGKKHALSAASMERINRRPRSDVLSKGEAVIVYVPAKGAPPRPSPALPAPSLPVDDLPALPSALPSSLPSDETGATGTASKDPPTPIVRKKAE